MYATQIHALGHQCNMWLEHANMQHTTISARLTTATLEAQARTVLASPRVVEGVSEKKCR